MEPKGLTCRDKGNAPWYTLWGSDAQIDSNEKPKVGMGCLTAISITPAIRAHPHKGLQAYKLTNLQSPYVRRILRASRALQHTVGKKSKEQNAICHASDLKRSRHHGSGSRMLTICAGCVFWENVLFIRRSRWRTALSDAILRPTGQ